MTIGEKLRDIRKEKGFTQKELGNMLGITPQMIAQYESGKRKPKLETLQRIAEALGISWEIFMDEDEPTGNSDNDHYYINDESRQIAQEVFENPELRTLFKVARDIPPERLKAHIEFMKSLKEQERGHYDEGC